MSTRLKVDLLDPHFYRDRERMHAAFTWMRANEPVYRDDRNGLWGITRHADLRDVERRSTVFLSSQGYRAIWAPDEINMIAQDDPRHRQQRLLVQGDLTGHAIAARRPEIAALVGELLDAALVVADRDGLDRAHGVGGDAQTVGQRGNAGGHAETFKRGPWHRARGRGRRLSPGRDHWAERRNALCG